MAQIVRIITVDTAADMVAARGSAAWYGRQESFETASHFVAVEKGSRKPFFIAEIEDVVPVPESGEKRWSLQFSRYAELDPADFKRDESSNPAIGMELSRLLPGLSIDQIDWQEAPSATQKWSFSNRVSVPESPKRGPRGLTIAEAKQGLSIGLGVREDQIDIIVRA